MLFRQQKICQQDTKFDPSPTSFEIKLWLFIRPLICVLNMLKSFKVSILYVTQFTYLLKQYKYNLNRNVNTLVYQKPDNFLYHGNVYPTLILSKMYFS